MNNQNPINQIPVKILKYFCGILWPIPVIPTSIKYFEHMKSLNMKYYISKSCIDNTVWFCKPVLKEIKIYELVTIIGLFTTIIYKTSTVFTLNKTTLAYFLRIEYYCCQNFNSQHKLWRCLIKTSSWIVPPNGTIKTIKYYENC